MCIRDSGNAAGAVAFVGDCFVLGLIAALSLLDDALDVIVGHGPGGVAVMVETLTDNRNRRCV